MSLVGKEGVQIGRIRRAGLSRVRAEAARKGLTPERISRDMAILRAVANGSIATAAEKCGVTQSAVRYALKLYEGFSKEIHAGDQRRGRYDAARKETA